MRVVGYEKTLKGASDKEVDTNNYFNEMPRFCYRSNYEPILNSKYKTDKGWGCCLRSSQSMIAQYILRLYKFYPDVFRQNLSKFLPNESSSPLCLFFDKPTAPFSIHNIIKNSTRLSPGVWAKPSDAADSFSNIFQSLNLSCKVFRDYLISPVLEDIKYPCLILIPGLFGLNKFDKDYLPLIQASLCMSGSLGFVSGKGNSAYYIAGFEENEFIYFDPHYTKNAFLNDNIDEIKSLYSIPPKKMKMEKLNQSILIGLMIHSDNDLENLQLIMTGISPSPFSISEEPTDEFLSQVIDIDDLDLNLDKEAQDEKKDEETY